MNTRAVALKKGTRMFNAFPQMHSSLMANNLTLPFKIADLHGNWSISKHHVFDGELVNTRPDQSPIACCKKQLLGRYTGAAAELTGNLTVSFMVPPVRVPVRL
jgi:hypothetical protein